jgi:hypothetical protein
MILSSDELEVLEYLKSWKGNFVSMVEICRCAGGRHKFKESPHWAKRLMSRLADEKLVEVNERGHYRYLGEPAPEGAEGVVAASEDYFTPVENPLIVGDDYFPPPELPAEAPRAKPKRWVSPQFENILKKSGKKPVKHRQHS